MADAKNTKRVSTTKSAVGILAIAILAIVIVAAIAYALTNPDVLESTLTVIFIVAVVLVAAMTVIYLVIGLLAIPMYAYKGETFQTGMDYDLDDVQSVGEKKDKDEPPKV